MTAANRNEEPAPRDDTPDANEDPSRSAATFDDALRGFGRDGSIDPASPGDDGRIEADRIPPAPIAPSRRWTLGAFVPVALLVGAIAAAIYLFMRA